MRLYRLERAPDEAAGEGEDWSEWFTSLRAAKRRRAELIAADPMLIDHRYGRDFEIMRVDAPAPSVTLLLAVFNRTPWMRRVETVVPAYVRPQVLFLTEESDSPCTLAKLVEANGELDSRNVDRLRNMKPGDSLDFDVGGGVTRVRAVPVP